MAGALAVSLVLVVLAALGVDLLEPGSMASPPPSASPGPSTSPTASTSSIPSASPAAPSASPAAPSASPASPAAASIVPSVAPSDAAGVVRAPTSALGFRPAATVVDIGLPFRAGTPVRLGEGWRAPRDGVVHPYELIRGVAPDGTLLRAHDGQDLLAPIGTLVVAPVAGVVVDAAMIWRPWDPARYGKVVVIRSAEPTSTRYLFIRAHLSRVSVPVGASVRRGQVVGRTGDTGNAGDTVPHLHIEIRAPFLIRYGYGGVIRWVDAFDIGPSLRAVAKAG